MGTEVVGAVALAEQVTALTPQSASGAMALAAMSDEEFNARLASTEKALKRVRQIQAQIMVKNEDYGVIPGTKKPTLLKPGAEKLCAFYRLVATYEERTEYGDGETRPWITVKVKAIFHLGSEGGPVVGEGLGSANSHESRYRYRKAQRSCPDCGVVGSVGRSKFEDRETGEKGWYCRDCRAQFGLGDERITGQELGKVVNSDPADVENTCLKIAKKRGYIDGTLTTTATSGLFTQDLEDLRGAGGGEGEGDDHGDEREAAGNGNGNGNGERQPGDDDEQEQHAGGDDYPNDQGAYTRHNVQPPRRQSSRGGSRAPEGPKVPCPSCGDPAGPSKFPKPGQTHYCYKCKLPFGHEAAR